MTPLPLVAVAAIVVFVAAVHPLHRCNAEDKPEKQLVEQGPALSVPKHATTREIQHLGKNSRPSAAALSFSPDGQILASASADDGTVRLWDVRGSSEICQINATPGDADFPSHYPVVFSPDGRTVATGGMRIMLWSLMGVRLRTLEDLDSPTYSLAFSPDGKSLASCENQSLVNIWDVATGARREVECPSDVMTVNYSPEAKLLIANEVSTLRDLASGRTLGRVDWILFDQGSPYSDDGRLFVQPHANEGEVACDLHDVATGRQLRRFTGHHGGLQHVISIAVSRDGRQLACSDDRGRISLWLVAGNR